MSGVWNRGRKSTALAALLICLLACISTTKVFAANETAAVSLPVEQTYTKTGTDIEAKGVFDYILTPNQAGNPMPAGSADDQYNFTLEGDESKNLDALTFTEEGIYEYTLKQVAGTATGYHYDTTVYTIWIQVINVNGELVAQTLLPIGDGSKHEKIIFNNAYQPEQTDLQLMVDPPVKKIVKGSPKSASEFVFTLVAKDPTSPMPEGSVDGKKEIKIIGEGEKEFGTWNYTAAGIYSYTVSEENTGISGYHYDKTIYTIMDTVTDKEGQLVLNRSITNGKEPASEYTFTNQYTKSNGGSNGSNSGGSSSYKGNVVKTGDATNLWIWVTLLGGAAIVLVVAIIIQRKGKKHNK